MSNTPKDIRKQVRNVTNEILPEILRSEVFQGLSTEIIKTIQGVVLARLDEIQAEIQANLQRIEANARDVQSFILNQVQADLAKQTPKVGSDE